MSFNLRHYQRAAIDCLYNHMRMHDDNPVAVLPTGCHAKGTRILMHDGSTKAVEDIAIGDCLMGPDSQPRHVLRLIRGAEMLYRITPKRGEPFVVNQNHMLCLRTTNEGKPHACCTTGNELDCLTVDDWLDKSKSWRHLRKLWRTGVDFPERPRPDLCPWALGALLGDGSLKHGIQFSKPDADILDAIWAEMQRHGLNYRANERGGAWHVAFTDKRANRTTPNRVTAILRELGVFGLGAGDKFIPDCYKLGSRQDRLDILAGLLDTDGHHNGRGGFDFISKSERLAEDLVFVARSLGFAAYCSPSEKYCQTGTGGTYWRVHVSGDTHLIPMRCKRKQAPPRRQKKNPLVTGFEVEPVGHGEFFGFTLDGDHLYLTADFTVHHNSGKTVVMAELIRHALTTWPGTRIAVVAHVKELVEQNADKLKRYWPEARIGIYAASLKRRDRFEPVIFASIQSVYNRAMQLGRFDLVLVDEVHRIPIRGEGMYRQFIADCQRANPDLRVIGLTATPYRLGTGPVTGPDYILNSIAYEASVKDLIEQGYLCKLISKGGAARADLSGVHVRGGEYVASELEAAVNRTELVESAVDEMLAYCHDRKAWIVFCASVAHAETVKESLTTRGISAAVVEGNTPLPEREATIARFQRGELRALVNVNVLSEGFDAPHVDAVILLRPTKSPGLYYQQVGRGLRLHPSKQDCLVLDFAGNILEHGPIDAIRVEKPKKRGDKAKVVTAPTKQCPACAKLILASLIRCPACEFEFPRTLAKHERTASDAPILSNEQRQALTNAFRVNAVHYALHEKPGGIPSLRVEYQSGLRTFREWVCLEHGGPVRARAVAWWKARMPPDLLDDPGNYLVPRTIENALNYVEHLRKPSHIHVFEGGKYPEIVHHEFEPDPGRESGNDCNTENRTGDYPIPPGQPQLHHLP